jgi:hypothetical protein
MKDLTTYELTSVNMDMDMRAIMAVYGPTVGDTQHIDEDIEGASATHIVLNPELQISGF